jgi:hypothetical protein
MTHLRERWEGASLDGKYTLQEWLAGDESTAFFQASIEPEGRAVVKLVPQTAGDGAALLELWYRIRQLRHPNLSELLDFGRAEHSGETAFYAAYESPDETLATALERSPLDSQESREVLDAVLDALRYLHAQGLVIGVLGAEHIVAVGDRIKLATHAVREAETSADYREDVRLFGELWHEALMPASPRSEELAAHAADPNPQTRWTLAEIHALLSPPLTTEPPPELTSDVLSPLVAPAMVETPVVTAWPSDGGDVPPLPRSRPSAPREVPIFHFPRWILVGAGAFLLLIFALNRPQRADVARPDVAKEPHVVPTPAPAPVEAPPPAPLKAPPKTPAVAAPKPAPPAGPEVWRVIAFTYRARSSAEKKAQQLNQYHPGLNATVFSPAGQHTYYLVSLGGRMTHEDAVKLQRSARGKGLPRDLYVQNFVE